jgi:tetratricopeptide (TPR) repeat protein
MLHTRISPLSLRPLRQAFPFFFAFFFSAALLGCTTVPLRTKTTIQGDAMVFYAKQGKVTHMEIRSPKELFEKAAEAFQANDYPRARDTYLRLLTTFPQSDYRILAMYNLALTHERLKEHPRSIELYKAIRKEKPQSEEARDAHFRLAAAYLIVKDFPLAVKTYAFLAEEKDVKTSDRLEILGSLGLAYFHLKRYTEAEDAFRRTLRLFEKESKNEYLGNDFFAAMAQFHIARIYDLRFRERAFRSEKEKLKEDLNYKASQLLTAQAHYIRAIRIRNPKWVVASLYQIGEMYQKMYDDMLNAPIPKDLDAEEKKVYQDMLKKKIRVLLDKAIIAYEKNLQAAENFGVQEDEFIKKTQAQLVSLRSRVLKEHLQGPSKHEEEAIRRELQQQPASRPAPQRQK